MADIIRTRSQYQKILIETDPLNWGEHTLYLDDMWQYGSAFEYRYHETIAILPAVCAPDVSKALICGGGDGLAARELLKFPSMSIDLVEIDGMMIDLYKTKNYLTRLNVNSLNDGRCNVFVEDALKFMERSEKGIYDLVILDFPSPGDGNEDKGYPELLSQQNVLGFLNLVKPNGILISQTSMTSEYLVPYARLFLEKGYYIWNLDSFYNTNGSHDNFTVCSKSRLTKQRQIPSGCRMITDDHVKYGFSDATEVTADDLEYLRLFQYVEGLDFEPVNAGQIN